MVEAETMINRETHPDLAIDILDTSAFRALSRRQIIRLRELGRIPTVSSLTLTELLCHLDEPSRKRDATGSFAYRRSQLLNARDACIIPDPMSLFRMRDDPVIELEIIRAVQV